MGRIGKSIGLFGWWLLQNQNRVEFQKRIEDNEWLGQKDILKTEISFE